MFERFSSLFTADVGVPQGGVWHDTALEAVAGYAELMGRFAGCSFDGGSYRFIQPSAGLSGRNLQLLRSPSC